MNRVGTILGLVLLSAGCDEATGPADADLEGIVEAARGKQDGFAIETELGASHDLSIERKPAGAETRPEHARALTFTVPAGQTFAVVMRGGTGGAFEPWLQLHDRDGVIATSDWDQAIVKDAHESDAVVVAHADTKTEYIAVVTDLDMRVDADFQVDLIPLDAPAPSVDLSTASIKAQAHLDGVRAAEASIISRNAVHEDGNGNLTADEDSPLIDRNKNNAANRVRDDYFAVLAELHEVPEEELRAVVGGLWAAMAEAEYQRR